MGESSYVKIFCNYEYKGEDNIPNNFTYEQINIILSNHGSSCKFKGTLMIIELRTNKNNPTNINDIFISKIYTMTSDNVKKNYNFLYLQNNQFTELNDQNYQFIYGYITITLPEIYKYYNELINLADLDQKLKELIKDLSLIGTNEQLSRIPLFKIEQGKTEDKKISLNNDIITDIKSKFKKFNYSTNLFSQKCYNSPFIIHYYH